MLKRVLAGQVESQSDEDTNTETEFIIEPAPEEETHFLSQSILTMLVVIGLNAIALNYLRKLKAKYPVVAQYVQDATITTLIGVIAGSYLYITSQGEILSMIRGGYQDFFMIILLPLILFEGTINMHQKSFFRNIGAILGFAVFGTLIAICLTALGIYFVGYSKLIPEFKFTLTESFAFGSLISSTDPVSVLGIFKEMGADRNLYSLIFGESILNDAIAIVLYKTITEIFLDGFDGSLGYPLLHFCLLLLGSVLIGFVIGICCAFILKAYFGNNGNSVENQSTEITIMIIIPWVAYLIGEGFNLSGVVVLLFCGISITKYALPHLTPSGKKLTQNLYHTLSSASENLVFLFIGIGFFSFEHHWKKFNWIIFLLSFIIIIASRHIQVMLISRITNMFRKEKKIPKSHQMVMSYSGFRGAMAFALATNAVKTYEDNGVGSMMLTLTLVYASLTIFVQGSFLVPVLEYFGVRSISEESSYDGEDELNESHSWKRVRQSFGKVENLFAKYLLKSRNDNDDNSGAMQEFVDEENCNTDLPKKSPHFLSRTTEIEINTVRRSQTSRQSDIDLDAHIPRKEVRSAQGKPSSFLFTNE